MPENANTKTINRAMIRTVAITGLMIAITFIMSFTFLGTIVLPAVSVTIAFLPVFVTAMTLGFYPGFAVATAAGLMAMFRAIIMPVTLLSPFLQNPLVSVLPRMMIAVTAFLVFRALIKTKLPKAVSVGVAAAVGSITNTVGVLGMMYIIYAAPLQQAVSNSTPHASVWAFFMFIVTTNAIIEVVVYTIITTLVVMTLRKARLSKY